MILSRVFGVVVQRLGHLDRGGGDRGVERGLAELGLDLALLRLGQALADVVAQLVEHFKDHIDEKTAVGVTVPAVVQHGLVLSAANIDPTWIEFEGEKALEKRLGRDVYLVNDADAAGYAELHYGAAMDENGLVILTTLGTGIGSAILYRNVLVPNSELGHLEIDGKDAESEAAVQRGLARLRQGRTTIIVAHRLSTVRDADLVIVMAEGAAVEQGTHAALLAGNGLYARLVRTQALAA